MNRPLSILLPFALALGQAAPTAAQDAAPPPADPALDAPIPFDPLVRHGTLPNGLVYYVRENREPRQRAELRLAIRAGSVLEDEDQRGLAHLVEHMAFNGTERFPKQALVDYLESTGMRFGPDVNAFTSFDQTVYMLTVPTDSAAIFETAFRVLDDWARRLAFDPDEVAKERPVVVEEWRLGRGAGMRTLDAHLPVLFRGSRYAERLPIGRKEVIEAAPVEALRRFYDAWYRPELAGVIAVGDFDADEVVERIRSTFGDWEGRAGAPERPSWPVPPHAETLVSIATDAETPVPNVSVYHKRPPRRATTIADYRRGMVESLRDRMLNRRYFELSQGADPPFLGAFAGGGRFVETADVYVLGAGLSETAIERGVAALVTEAERADRHGFTATELEREKLELLRGVESAHDEREKTPSDRHAAALMSRFLEGAPVPGAEAALGLHQRFVPGIELGEVEALAREAISEESRVVLLTAPEKEGVVVPTEEGLQAAFRAAAAGEVEPYADTTPAGPLVADPPPPGRIVAERTIEEIGVTVWELSNGAEVWLKPTDFKDDEIVLQAWSSGGTSLVPDSLVVAAETAGMVVAQGGVGDLDLVDLQKALAGRQVMVRPYVGFLDEGFFGRASPRDLETLFQLVWLYGTAPRRDPDAFSSLRTRIAASVANRAASPEATFQDSLAAILADRHPRTLARLPGPAMLEGMDLEASHRIYRDRFADFGDFAFALAGAFRPEDVRPLVERWLASLPAEGREETWRDVGVDPPAGMVERTIEKGIEPKSLTAVVFTGPFEWSLENSNALIFLADYLRIRLREELREDLGGTYGVSVSASGQRWPDPEAHLRLTFGSDPERLEELVPVVFDELELVRSGEVDAEDFAKVKETGRRELEVSLRENLWWARQLQHYHWNDVDPSEILRIGERIDAIDPSAIVEAVRRWFDPGRHVRVTLVPAPGADAGVPDPGS